MCKGAEGEAGKVMVVEGGEVITEHRKEMEATQLVLTLDMSMEVCMPKRALYLLLNQPPLHSKEAC